MWKIRLSTSSRRFHQKCRRREEGKTFKSFSLSKKASWVGEERREERRQQRRQRNCYIDCRGDERQKKKKKEATGSFFHFHSCVRQIGFCVGGSLSVPCVRGVASTVSVCVCVCRVATVVRMLHYRQSAMIGRRTMITTQNDIEAISGHGNEKDNRRNKKCSRWYVDSDDDRWKGWWRCRTKRQRFQISRSNWKKGRSTFCRLQLVLSFFFLFCFRCCAFSITRPVSLSGHQPFLQTDE